MLNGNHETKIAKILHSAKGVGRGKKVQPKILFLVSKADEDDDSVRTWMKCRSRSNFCQCNARVEVF